MMENFDKKIKESLEQHELPLDPAAWAGMEAALDKAMPATGGAESTGSSWGLYAAGGAIVVAGGIALFSMLSINENNIGESIQTAPQTSTVEQGEIPQPEGNAKENAVIDQEEQSTRAAKADEGVAHSDNKPVVETIDPVKSTMPEKGNPSDVVTEHEIADDVETENLVEQPTKGNLLIQFTPSARKVCAGETVSFLNNTFEKEVDFAWNFGDGNTSSETDPNHVFATPGTYSVNLAGTRKGTSTSSEQTIQILVKPSPNTEILSEVSGMVENLITYRCNLKPDESAEWRFNDGMIVTGEEVTHLYRKAGPKPVKLTVKNEAGCVFRTSMSENITQKLEFYAGNTFTANGDMNNDDFFIKMMRELKVPFTFVIRDASNRVVFSTTDPMVGWNGKLNNTGADLPEGLYFWQLELDSNYLRDNKKTGSVTLKRN